MNTERPTGFYYVQYQPGHEDTIEVNWDVQLTHSIAFYAHFKNPKLPGALWYTIGSEMGHEEEHMGFVSEPVPVPELINPQSIVVTNVIGTLKEGMIITGGGLDGPHRIIKLPK